MSELSSIGERIKQRRQQLGITQKKLAEMIGVKPPSLHGLESGRAKSPSAKTLQALSKALHVTPEWILDGIGEPGSVCEFSDRLKVRMNELGIKQKDIMEATGKTSGAVSSWVNGHYLPSGQALTDLANLLQTTPEWLISGQNPDNNPEFPSLYQALSFIERHLRYRSSEQREILGDLLRHFAVCKDSKTQKILKETIEKLLSTSEKKNDSIRA